MSDMFSLISDPLVICIFWMIHIAMLGISSPPSLTKTSALVIRIQPRASCTSCFLSEDGIPWPRSRILFTRPPLCVTVCLPPPPSSGLPSPFSFHPGGRLSEVAVLTSCLGPRRSNEPNQRERGAGGKGSAMNPLQCTAIWQNMK